MIPEIAYGPYYKSSRRALESKKRLLGQPGLTPEEVAGERYGELSAYLQDARSRRDAERDYALRSGYLGLESRQLRNQERGEKAAGYATMLGGGGKLYEAFGPTIKKVGGKAIGGVKGLLGAQGTQGYTPTYQSSDYGPMWEDEYTGGYGMGEWGDYMNYPTGEYGIPEYETGGYSAGGK